MIASAETHWFGITTRWGIKFSKGNWYNVCQQAEASFES